MLHYLFLQSVHYDKTVTLPHSLHFQHYLLLHLQYYQSALLLNPLSLLASSLIEFASVSINSHPLATSSCLATSSVTSSPRVFLSEFISSAISSSMFMPVDFVKASNKMNVSKANAGRLVMTESAYFSSTAQKECFKELDVERYEL